MKSVEFVRYGDILKIQKFKNCCQNWNENKCWGRCQCCLSRWPIIHAAFHWRRSSFVGHFSWKTKQNLDEVCFTVFSYIKSLQLLIVALLMSDTYNYNISDIENICMNSFILLHLTALHKYYLSWFS